MADSASQSYANHTRYVPGYHYLLLTLLTINLLWTGYRLFREPSVDRGVSFLVAIALGLLAYYARSFALRAQDRVIRLEERLRLTRLLPADQHGRIDALRTSQLIALRFASDEEVPALAARVFAGELTKPKEIKQAIRNWRADHLRA